MSFNLKSLYHLSNGNSDQQVELCFSRKTVFIKPLKVKDRTEVMKAIEMKDEILINRSIDTVISKYVETDKAPLDPNILTLQERHQILTCIRVAYGEGAATNIMHQCPKCEHLEKKIKFDFADLDTVNNDGPETYTVKIAKDNFELVVGIVYRKDEKIAESYNKKNKIKSVAESQISLLAAAIRSIKYIGNPSEGSTLEEINAQLAEMKFEEKVAFIQDLKQNDLSIITDVLNQFKFGLKIPVDFTCSKCDYSGTEEANALLFFIS